MKAHYELEVRSFDAATDAWGWTPVEDAEEFLSPCAAQLHQGGYACADRMRVVEVVGGTREPME